MLYVNEAQDQRAAHLYVAGVVTRFFFPVQLTNHVPIPSRDNRFMSFPKWQGQLWGPPSILHNG
jgi:hypothetical protein